METFNIIAFLVTDLGHLKEFLGKCLYISMFGCYWCKKNMLDWDKKKPTMSPLQKISDMVEMGKKLNAVCSIYKVSADPFWSDRKYCMYILTYQFLKYTCGGFKFILFILFHSAGNFK
jgi:hypothetical protein